MKAMYSELYELYLYIRASEMTAIPLFTSLQCVIYSAYCQITTISTTKPLKCVPTDNCSVEVFRGMDLYPIIYRGFPHNPPLQMWGLAKCPGWPAVNGSEGARMQYRISGVD